MVREELARRLDELLVSAGCAGPVKTKSLLDGSNHSWKGSS